MSQNLKLNYKMDETEYNVTDLLDDPNFTTGVYEYVNRIPFREFKNKNQQFLYERGRQFAAYLTHLGYDANIIKTNTNYLVKEFKQAIETKTLI